MSKEREVIYAMIEERENQARVGSRQIDKLYDKYDSNAPRYGVMELHDAISALYKEILLLKMVLMAADAPENS